jgi:arabinan endo-1,5-alpha-L-arabinosidase
VQTIIQTVKPAKKIYRRCLDLFAIGSVVLCSVEHAGSQTNSAFFQNRVHDPSNIIRDGQRFWIFSTGDGIKTLHSTDLQDWTPGKPALDKNPTWAKDVAAVHRDYFWAPDIIRAGDTFMLYYSVSSWGKNTSAIGLATNVTLDPSRPEFSWQDAGIVIRTFETNDFNAIDPAVSFDAEGRLWMTLGSYWSGIKLIELDPRSGHRISPESPIHTLAKNASIEAAYIHRRTTNYFLFVNWGQCCRGTNSTYEIRVGRSTKITGPYLDRDGKDMARGGGTLFLSSQPPFYGPGHTSIANIGGQDWFSCHYYDGRRRGSARLWVGKLGWDDDGWPIPPILSESNSLNTP